MITFWASRLRSNAFIVAAADANSLPQERFLYSANEYLQVIWGSWGPCLNLFGVCHRASLRNGWFLLNMLHMRQDEERETTAKKHDSLRAQRELEVFGASSDSTGDGKLTTIEKWWSQHFEWLKGSGYLLRPRYAPNWIPSWHGTGKSMLLCEDSSIPMVRHTGHF